ncbi:helicase associated domain-containing protein [Streptomyces sp. NPDC050485]|uniref:helicase associated domain-containing protein n=1 Tax=Streptomyces sp. NPDC050485 TaxID=3365617 RepID=UPI00378BB5B1
MPRKGIRRAERPFGTSWPAASTGPSSPWPSTADSRQPAVELPTKAPAPAANGGKKTARKASAAFQRGVAALAQYIAREGHHRAPRAHAEEIAMEGETAPMVVKLGVWISNTKARRDKLNGERLAGLGIDGA